MGKKLFILLVIYLSTDLFANAQTVEWLNLPSGRQNSGDTTTGMLNLQINTSNFIKDNEYFNQMVEGYTLIGFWAEPTLQYILDNRTHIRGGLSWVRFFGKEGFYSNEPILSVEHWFTPHISLTLGSLDYGQRGLPAPLFDPERYYLKRVDNGALFGVYTSHFSTQTWLSWDRFSFYGDSTQEHISAGSSNLLTLLQGEKFTIKLPFYFVVTHKGGQVLRPKQPIETLVNAGTGASFTWNINHLSIEINPNFFIYQKPTSHPSQPFSRGWALYPVVHLSYGKLTWESSWWYSQKFIAPLGEKIYAQLSTYQVNYTENARQTATNKLAYRCPIAPGMRLETAFESYYFPAEKRMDYNFWVHFNWNFNHPLLKLKP